MNSLSKLQAQLKLYTELENLPIEEYAKVVSTKVGVLLKLLNTLHEDKIQMPTWKIWSEPLLKLPLKHLLILPKKTINPTQIGQMKASN